MAMQYFRWDGADAWQWLERGALRQGDTAAAASAAGGQPVGVVLAAPQVWVTAQTLPRLSTPRLARAAMFALEEQLASDLDAVQVAVGKRRADGLTELAVVGRAQLDAALARLREAGMKVAGITPLAALLPVDAFSVLAEPDHLTVRLGAQASLCGAPHEIGHLLEALAPAGVRWLQAPGGPPPPPGLDAQITEVPAEQALCLAVTPASPELLQGAYAPARPPGQWRPWRPAAVLAAMWLALLLAGGLFETARLGRQNTALRTAIAEQFTRLFPEEGRPVSLRAQAQRRLKLLDRGARGGALPLLAVAARALPPGQTLTALDYRDGALTLELGLPDVAAVEALRSRLAAERAIKADLPMAVAEGGVVRTRLILRPAPGATDVATQEGP